MHIAHTNTSSKSKLTTTYIVYYRFSATRNLMRAFHNGDWNFVMGRDPGRDDGSEDSQLIR